MVNYSLLVKRGVSIVGDEKIEILEPNLVADSLDLDVQKLLNSGFTLEI